MTIHKLEKNVFFFFDVSIVCECRFSATKKNSHTRKKKKRVLFIAGTSQNTSFVMKAKNQHSPDLPVKEKLYTKTTILSKVTTVSEG